MTTTNPNGDPDRRQPDDAAELAAEHTVGELAELLGDIPQWDATTVLAGVELSWLELLERARAAGRDPALASLDDDQLVTELGRHSARIAASMCAYLEMVAELTVRGIWADHGARTPGQWLSFQLGLGPSTAADHIRVGLRLRELPAIRDRFAAGQISYSKVRAITRIAIPETQQLLLRWARYATGSEVERIISAFRSTCRTGDDPSLPDQQRSFRTRRNGDGTTTITVRIPDHEAAAIEANLDRLLDLDRPTTDPDPASSAEDTHTPTTDQQPEPNPSAEDRNGLARDPQPEPSSAEDTHTPSDPGSTRPSSAEDEDVSDEWGPEAWEPEPTAAHDPNGWSWLTTDDTHTTPEPSSAEDGNVPAAVRQPDPSSAEDALEPDTPPEPSSADNRVELARVGSDSAPGSAPTTDTLPAPLGLEGLLALDAAGAGTEIRYPTTRHSTDIPDPTPPPLQHEQRSRSARLADALVDACARAAATTGTDTSGMDRHTLVLRADLTDLADPANPADPQPRHIPVDTPSGRLRTMPAQVLRRLACDAGIVLVATTGRLPIDVGRLQRRPTAAQRRALHVRDRTCRFPGCDTHRNLHAHHIVHWADDGPTDLANLILVCSFHHRFVHEHAWQITPAAAGTFRFAPPNGDPLPTTGIPPDLDPTTLHTDDHDHADPRHGTPNDHTRGWALRATDRHPTHNLDLHLAIQILHQELRAILPDTDHLDLAS